jgi:hypothetical protein
MGSYPLRNGLHKLAHSSMRGLSSILFLDSQLNINDRVSTRAIQRAREPREQEKHGGQWVKSRGNTVTNKVKKTPVLSDLMGTDGVWAPPCPPTRVAAHVSSVLSHLAVHQDRSTSHTRKALREHCAEMIRTKNRRQGVSSINRQHMIMEWEGQNKQHILNSKLESQTSHTH